MTRSLRHTFTARIICYPLSISLRHRAIPTVRRYLTRRIRIHTVKSSVLPVKFSGKPDCVTNSLQYYDTGKPAWIELAGQSTRPGTLSPRFNDREYGTSTAFREHARRTPEELLDTLIDDELLGRVIMPAKEGDVSGYCGEETLGKWESYRIDSKEHPKRTWKESRWRHKGQSSPDPGQSIKSKAKAC